MDHLYTGGPCPPEYLELYLCRDVYGCTPRELREQDATIVLAHLTCLGMEAEKRAAR